MIIDFLRNFGAWLLQVLDQERRSLRGRLLFTLLGLLLALLVLEVWQHQARLETRRQVLGRAHELAAKSTAAAFRAGLEQIYRTQQVVARTVLARRIGPDLLPAYLEEIRTLYPAMVNLQVIALEGNVRFGAPAPLPNQTVQGQAFLRALTPQQPRHLSGLYGSTPAERRFRVASLHQDPTLRETTIIAMEFEAEAVRDLLSHREEGQTELLLDGRGRLVYSSRPLTNPAALPAHRGLARALTHTLAVSRTGIPPRAMSLEEFRLGGAEELMGAAIPVSGTDWTAVYLRPEAESLALVARDNRASVLFIIALTLALMLAVLIVVRVSLRPVVALSAGARLLGRGNLSVRIPKADVREFDAVADAFNRMAEELEAAQRGLVEVNRHLEQRVRERTRELEEEHEKLLRAERLSNLGLFSSAIAHDLRNPLNTVSLSVEWLRQRLADERDPRVRERLETIQREVRRSGRIIRSLLAFARTGEPVRQPTDLNVLVEEVVSVVPVPEGIELVRELAADLPPVPADRDQLFQVLENLLRNALQAMPEGGRICVGSRATDDGCRLVVSDTGPGIPAELQASIFEPLVTTKASGTGLGLALCKRIVEAHGGMISIESRPGEGAAFSIDLPVAEAGAGHPGAGEPVSVAA